MGDLSASMPYQSCPRAMQAFSHRFTKQSTAECYACRKGPAVLACATNNHWDAKGRKGPGGGGKYSCK
jgi:hypothetical protein